MASQSKSSSSTPSTTRSPSPPKHHPSPNTQARSEVRAEADKNAAAEEARLYQLADKASDLAFETAQRSAVAYMATCAARKRKAKAIKAYEAAANLSRSLDLQETVDQEKADVAQRDAEHADLAAASAIFQLKSTVKTEDAFLLFKGNVDKDEDLDPNVRERMMKRSREHFFGFGQGHR